MQTPLKTADAIPNEPAFLDHYLRRLESGVAHIRDGCEKKIVWHQGLPQKRKAVIVYLHGFSASRMETWPLCDRLAHAIGANLFYTRLTGHGQDGSAMASATVRDWLNDGREALLIGQRLGEKIILVGTSTGGTLATLLAAQPETASAVDQVILISPNFFPKNPLSTLTLMPLATRVLEGWFGQWKAFTITNRVQARYWTERYPFRALTPMMQLVCLVWKTNLEKAGMPILMLVNPEDRVINVSLAKWRFSHFPCRRNRMVFFRENKDIGRHVLAGDLMAPEGTEKALKLIQRFVEVS